MDRQASKRFLFRASGTGFAGQFTSPFADIIPVQAPGALPDIGGVAHTRVDQFDYKGLISFGAAHTRVTGVRNEDEKAFNVLATSSVEKLNILDQVTADRIVARIAIRYEDGQPARFFSVGSYFENLRIGGCAIDVEMDGALVCNNGFGNLVAAAKSEDMRQRLLYLLPDGNFPAGQQLMMLTLAKNIRFDGRSPNGDKPYCTSVYVPNFGRIYLAELTVTPVSASITMLRAELGCSYTGSHSVAMADGQGQHYPPGIIQPPAGGTFKAMDDPGGGGQHYPPG
jgi:hypothetical protein